MEDLRFYVQPEPGRVVGPISDDELRDALRNGRYPADVPVRHGDAPLWLPARAWATLALPLGNPPPAPAGDAAAAGNGCVVRYHSREQHEPDHHSHPDRHVYCP